ncbi:MAG: hypothetical protein P4M09_17050 [Devosia sp.]|nr:hypothetical protein [Devosia sp.]
MTEQLKNGFDDDDLKSVVSNIEDLEAEIKTVMATAMNEAKKLRTKIKDIRLEAKSDLNIPLKSLSALLKTRKLQKKLEEIAADVPDDQAEIFEDMVGQFSFLPPVDDEDTPAKSAAKRRKKQAQADSEAEQEEGARVLDELVH